MKPTMCAELSAHAQIGAVREQRRFNLRLRKAAALIRADVDVYGSTPVVSPSRRRAEHLALPTFRRSHAG